VQATIIELSCALPIYRNQASVGTGYVLPPAAIEAATDVKANAVEDTSDGLSLEPYGCVIVFFCC